MNLVDGVIEVHTDPRDTSYARQTTFRRGERIRLVRLPDIEIDVDAVLPA